ncbi:MAG: cell division protein FtsL [Clostridiales bacterium]|nr:cell division protein FtsL [Clostridiales bacterium]
MATTQKRRQTGRTASQPARTAGRGSYYVQGNVVRKLDVTKEIERQPQKKISNAARKNREKANHMNVGYVLFLCAALVATGLILIRYIGLQSDITNSVQHISALESQLNELKLANDEEYSRITSSIDLEEIKRIAIQELGMQYAEEGQVVTFASENSDYVKQMADIPQ